MPLFDLSVPIRDGVDWYRDPTTPAVRLKNVGSIEKLGWVSQTLTLQVLNGTTYLETSGHMYPDGPSIDQVPPEKLLCRAHVVPVTPAGQELAVPESPLAQFRAGEDALLLYCGWDAHLEDPKFYSSSPYFSKPLQSWILDMQPSILGGDMVSYDHPADAAMPFLRTYFRRGGMILCPLTGLGKVGRRTVTLCAAPLKLVGANAAPCRALAWF